MTAPTLFAGDGEPCASCGSPLAADQRYCLTCGHRRAAARLPFLEILREETDTRLLPLGAPIGAAAPAAAVVDDTLLGRARANTGLIAGVGVLLLAMLIGVLLGAGIGSDDNGSSALANQKPIVVSVGGGVAAAPAAAATTPTDTGAATTTEATTPTTASDTTKPEDSATTGKATIKPKAVSKSTIKSLDKLSGKEYQKQIDKLGKNISVGGKAPPKDNKPAAGGGDFEDIG